MQASQWIEIIQRVPVEFHSGLSFIMNNGLEIVLEVVIRLDEDFMMCRGRASGSTDSGMTFFIPYDQINCLSYTKMLKVPVVQAWFPEPSPYALPTVAAPAAAPVEEPEQPEEEQPEPAPAAKPAAGAPRPGAAPARPAAPPQRPSAPQPSPLSMPGMPMPAKAAMIERLRKRAHEGGPKPPEQK